jgi:hypothetical protein
MFVIKKDRLFEVIDKMEEDGVLVASSGGYRLTKIAFNQYREDPSTVKNAIKDKYIDYTADAHAPVDIEKITANRIEYERTKEPHSNKENNKIISIKPKLTGNLAVDVVIVIAYSLMGDRFVKGKRLPSWISINNIIEILKEHYVFKT